MMKTSISKNITVDVLWIDIESSQLWSTQQWVNHVIIEQLMDDGEVVVMEMCSISHTACNTTFGFYVSEKTWNTLMGADYTAQANRPLWWVNYDGQQVS